MSATEAIIILVVDIIAWGFFHYSISIVCFHIPLRHFERDLRFYRSASWEKNGKLWNQLFFVRSWKKHLIDGSSIMKQSFNKRYLRGGTVQQLQEFAAETKRAELTHWLLILPAPLFFLWNPVWAGWTMIGYALVVNLPFIVAQRYNRGRMEMIIQRKMKRG